MEDTITITRAEYDRLRSDAEDLADLRTGERVLAAIAAGEDELIPAEYADRLLAGESPVRVYRDLRGRTQMDLAKLAGVNRVQIADIEAGRSVGSVATIKKLAEALGVSIDDLV